MSATGKASVAILLVAAFVAGILFTTAGANLFGLGDKVGTDSQARTTEVNVQTGSADELSEAFAQVTESVSPTVVQIRPGREVEGFRNPFEGTPFEDFFGVPDDQGPQFQQGLGSGVVVRPDGYIITNYHVVAEADEVSVVMSDGEEYEAEVVGTDEYSDLAVVRIDADDLTTIAFGSTDDVRAGYWVLAFGSPLSEDLENTVTAGIISAKGRLSEGTAQINLASELIQTDAAINPGNSGGPLVNLSGEMVGINSAIYSRTGGFQGIGFAIPVNVVENVAEQLIENGSVERGYLGVTFDRVSESLSRALDVPRNSAQITNVDPDTPADQAGLEAGDIVVAIDGQQLTNFNQLRTIIGNRRPGEEVEMEIVNEDGNRSTVTVELGERPDDLFAQGNQQEPGSEGGGEDEGAEELESLGLSLRNTTPSVLQDLGLENTEEFQGVVITDIDQTSNAYRDAELRERDIIIEINRERVQDREEFMEVYQNIGAGETFLVRVVRPLRAQGGVQAQSFVTALSKPSS